MSSSDKGAEIDDKEVRVEIGGKEVSVENEQGYKKLKLKSYVTSFNLIWGTIFLISIILGICLWTFRGSVNITIDINTNIMLLCAKLICIAFQKFLTFIGIIGEIFIFMGVKGKFFTFYATISIIVLAISVLGIIL